MLWLDYFLLIYHIIILSSSVSKLLLNVFNESKGQGYTQSQLIDRFEIELEKAVLEQQAKATQPKAKARGKVPTVKARTQKSSSNIKTGKARKMKEHGKVRK